MGLTGDKGSSGAGVLEQAQRGTRARSAILRHMRNVRLLVAAAVAVALLGCGQKGPLVLPDAQHPHKKIGVRQGSLPLRATSAPRRGAPSSGKAPPPDARDPAPQPKEPV